MKKIKLLVWVLIISLMPIFQLPIFAQSEVIETISGTFPNSIGYKCSICVLQNGVQSASTPNDVYYADEKRVDSDGNVTFDVAFPDEAGTYNYILKTSQNESKNGTVVIESEEPDPIEEAYYVLDEDFSMPLANSGDILDRCAWDLLEGTATDSMDTSNIWYGGDNGVRLFDRDSSSRVVAQRTFEKITDSVVNVEMRLCISDATTAGWGFALYSGETEVLSGILHDNGLYFENHRVAGYGTGGTVGVKLEIDLAQKIYRVIVNGNEKVMGVDTATNSIDSIRFFTSQEGTGRLDTGPVRISKNYYAADEFVPYGSSSTLTASSNWIASGNVSTVTTKGTPAGDTFSLALTDNSTSGVASIKQQYRKVLEGKEVITFKTYSPNSSINMLNIDAGDLKAKIEADKFYVKNASGKYDYICDVPKTIWNTFRITANCKRGTAVIQLNGKEKKYNQSFAKATTELDKISFSTGASTTDTIWLDDIYVFDAPIIDKDYPTEPAKLEKTDSDVIVGMQTCDLWHEGKHFGWDKIADQPNRIPYLGLYDDGSPEVKDWEIKWMVEHGIDYSIHCWYRPGNIGTPIKEPRNGYSIHDGYFNAQYKDKLKFAIAWENGGFKLSGSLTEDDMLNDFKNNIVPFWVEYYFKDPNYLVIDNKIVVNIYQVSGLKSAMGEAGMTEAIEYLKNAVKALGFDGIYLIGTTSSASTSILQEYKDFGYDAIYCYSYGTSNYTFARQQNNIMRQKENGIISYIPTLAMGRDDSAWNRTSGGFSTPDGVKQLAQWVKDRYFPNGASGTELGDRMIVIDNWNEFGEGHFFMPTKLGGFGYLEAIGSVFGQPAHTDVRPEDTARLGHLYDQSRIDKVTPRENEYSIFDKLKDTPLIRWDFENKSLDGFTAGSGVSLSAPGSTLQGTATNIGWLTTKYTADPQIYSPDNLGIRLTGNEVVHVKYRSPLNSANSMKIYFKTDSTSSFAEANAVGADVPANRAQPTTNGTYEDIYIDMSYNSNWSGTLKQLRVDPYQLSANTTTKYTFNIDYIEVLSYNDGRYIPQNFHIDFAGYMDGSKNVLDSVPETSQNGTVKFSYTNPFKEVACKVFVAEYAENTLVNIFYNDTETLITGESEIEMPVEYNPGHEYKSGIWNDVMKPLIDAQDLN